MPKLNIKLQAPNWLLAGLERTRHHVRNRPIYTGILLIVTYFMLDYQLMGKRLLVDDAFLLVAVVLALGLLFACYTFPMIRDQVVHDDDTIPDRARASKKQQIRYFGVLAIAVLAVVIAYDAIIGFIAPALVRGYLKQETLMFIVFAPILEELAYRHVLYDRWAKKKYGVYIGMAIIGTIFVLTHPIVNTQGFIVYWLPTLLFFLVYDSFGLYGAIAAHVLFNIIALT